MKIITFASVIFVSCLALAACGKEGSGSPSPVTPVDTTSPQLSFSPSSATVESDLTVAVTLTATDNVGIVSGPTTSCTNGGAFSNNVFSAPTVTANTTSVCTATASDAAGNTGTATLTVTVTPPDTTPPTLSFSPDTVTVNTGETVASTLTATDDRAITSGPDTTCTNGGTFSNNVFTAPTVTADTTSVCTATASDAAGNTGTAILTATIIGPPMAPEFSGNTQFTQEENKREEFPIFASDPQGDTLTLTILPANDGALFELDTATNVVKFVNAPNFEVPEDGNTDNIYEFTVQASDGTNTATQDYDVTVTDVAEGLALTGKVTLGPLSSEPSTTTQTELASLGDWTLDGHSDLMIVRREYNANIDDNVANLFLIPGKTLHDTADSNLAVKNLQTGVRFTTQAPSPARDNVLMSARPVPDIFGDGLPEIFLYDFDTDTDNITALILDSAALAPLLNNGVLDTIPLSSVQPDYGIILKGGNQRDLAADFYLNLLFIDDVTGDGAADILYCQAASDPARSTDFARRRSFILGSEVMSQARVSETTLFFTLRPHDPNQNVTTLPPTLANRVFIDTEDQTLMSGCFEAAGDIDGDGLGDLLLDANRTLESYHYLPFSQVIRPSRTVDQAYVVWGHAISGLINTGGTLLLENLAASGDGIVFTSQHNNMRAQVVGDMNADGFADFLIEDDDGNPPDPGTIYNLYHVLGTPPTLLARYPNGEIDPATLLSTERFTSNRENGIGRREFVQWLVDDMPVDIDQDGQFEWIYSGVRFSSDETTARFFHFEPEELAGRNLSYYFGPTNSIASFEYAGQRSVGGSFNPEYFIRRGFAKDIDNDGIAELLGEKDGVSFILSGTKVQENINNNILDLRTAFPTVFD